MKISQILDKIDDNQLFVPAFQREYVWKREHAKRLLESLIKEYPTGTMLTWETNNPPELKGKHKYDPRQGAIKLILDGQQRITTLYMLVRGEIPPYYTAKEIKEDTRNMYVNVETLEISYYKKIPMQHDPRWVNITDIFQRKTRSRDISRALEERQGTVTREQEDTIDNNVRAVERILDRDFLELSIPIRATIKEAIDIFYIVNASGVSLTEAELALAQISGYWPQARQLFKNKLDQLTQKGFIFKLDFIVYVLLGVLYNSGSEMQKLHTEDNLEQIQAAWKLLDEYTLDYVVDILRDQAYVGHTKEISSVFALLPIIVYTFKKGRDPLSQTEIKKIVKWFYYSQIRRRYTSQSPQKLDKDNNIAANSENPFDQLLGIIQAERPLEISKEEFVGADIRNPLYSMMVWYFKSRHAPCFTKGIGLHQPMGKRYTLTCDHIFPYSLLKEYGYGHGNRLKYALAQEITNRAVLTIEDSRVEGKFTAADYLAHVQEQAPKALELQSIPTNVALWQPENFETFLAVRREMLANELNAYLNDITATESADVAIFIEDLIAEGESDELEFKSSVWWSYDDGVSKDDLEFMVLKTIAAFCNGNGGTILIGVNDEGAILGLEPDYGIVKGTKDEFELRLRSKINSIFGVDVATRYLTITFPAVNGSEICRIDVRPSEKPLFIQVKKKNAPPEDVFYVRSGNATQPFSTKEMANYIAARFRKNG